MVLKAVAMQQPFLLSYPSSNASKAVIRLTEKLAGEKQEASGNMRWGCQSCSPGCSIALKAITFSTGFNMEEVK